MIFFTDFAVPEGCAGYTLGLHSLLYLFSSDYRLKAEIEAYQEQLKYSPHDLMRFAEFLVSKYDLGIPDTLSAVHYLEEAP